MTGTALVTGGGRGIGLAIARALVADGWHVGVMGRERDALLPLEAEGMVPLQADVADTDMVQQAVADLEKTAGPVRLLVNNAGQQQAVGPMDQADPGAWWRVVEVNLRGPFVCAMAVIPSMKAAGGGRIINIGSYMANAPSTMSGAYAVSKTALLRLTDCLDLELKDRNIFAFAVSPGWVETDMTRAMSEGLRRHRPEFKVASEFVFAPEASGALICRLARGEADALHGRFLHVKDDLDALVSDAEQIVADDRHALRVRL